MRICVSCPEWDVLVTIRMSKICFDSWVNHTISSGLAFEEIPYLFDLQNFRRFENFHMRHVARHIHISMSPADGVVQCKDTLCTTCGAFVEDLLDIVEHQRKWESKQQCHGHAIEMTIQIKVRTTFLSNTPLRLPFFQNKVENAHLQCNHWKTLQTAASKHMICHALFQEANRLIAWSDAKTLYILFQFSLINQLYRWVLIH